MNKHQYDAQMETLEAAIRVENVRGKQHDVIKAKHDATAKEAQAKQAGVKTQIATQHVLTEQHHLTQARYETTTAKLTAEQKSQDVRQLTRENPLRQKALDIKFEGLQTDTDTARKILNERKTYLKQLGNL